MNVLFDMNVVLDVLLERESFVDAAAKLFALVDNGCISGSVCATTITTVFHIAAKDFGQRIAVEARLRSERHQAPARGSTGATALVQLERRIVGMEFWHHRL